jgi:LCP family protein required for cell wall assembly
MAERRRTVARHGRLDAPSIARRLMTSLAVAVAVVLVAGAGTLAYFAIDLTGRAADNAVAIGDADDPPLDAPSIGAYADAFDLLIVGTDECEPELAPLLRERCSGADAEGIRNDVNLLVHVSAEPRRVTVVSFPRDLQVPIPECVDAGGATRAASAKASINTAYERGELRCVVETVSELSGFDIAFAAKASFGNVVAITEAIGGVDVCIGNGGIRDRHTGIDWPAGPRTVRGFDALQFLRTRHGLQGESDLSRIGNQQQYLSSLTRKLGGEQVLGDPAALLRLANAAVDNITPSESLADPLRIVQLALAVKDVPREDVTFVQYPVFDDPADRNHVIPDDDAAEVLWEALAANQAIEVTGDAGQGVIAQTPAPAEPVAPPATAEPGASPSAPQSAVELPSNISGSTADVVTCSAGNLAG